MRNAKNILDTFKKVDIFVENPGNPGQVSVISNIEIIQFDIIGMLTEVEGEVIFFPWGAIRMMKPIIEEGSVNE